MPRAIHRWQRSNTGRHSVWSTARTIVESACYPSLRVAPARSIAAASGLWADARTRISRSKAPRAAMKSGFVRRARKRHARKSAPCCKRRSCRRSLSLGHEWRADAALALHPRSARERPVLAPERERVAFCKLRHLATTYRGCMRFSWLGRSLRWALRPELQFSRSLASVTQRTFIVQRYTSCNGHHANGCDAVFATGLRRHAARSGHSAGDPSYRGA